MKTFFFVCSIIGTASLAIIISVCVIHGKEGNSDAMYGWALTAAWTCFYTGQCIYNYIKLRIQ